MKLTHALVSIGLVLSASACGNGGGGGGGKAPVLTSVSPEQGSSHTIWTLHGEDFPKKLSDIDVWFDGELATVLSVSTGRDAIRVTNAFTPVTEAQTKAVEVRVGSKRSGVIAVTAVPDGHSREMNDGDVFPGAGSVLAADGSTVYFGDPIRGVFAYDLGTRVFTPLLRPGVEVYEVTHIAAAGGRILVADLDASGAPNVRMWDAETREMIWSDNDSAGVNALGLAPDGTAYVASDSADVVQYDPDGGIVPSYAPALGEDCDGIAVRGANIYCTQPGAGEVVQIDAAGTVTDFTLSTIGSASAIATDGTNLFVGGATGLFQVNSGGTVSTFATAGPASGNMVLQIAFADGEPVVLTDASGEDNNLFSYSSGSQFRLVGGVLNLVLAIERAGDELLLADNKFQCPYDSAGTAYGLVFGLGPAGGRIVTTEACALIGLEVAPSGDVWFTSAVPGIVGTIDLETGAATAVVGSADLLNIPYAIAIDQSNGEIFLSMVQLPGSTEIGKLSATGEVLDESIGDTLPGASLSLFVDGGTVFASPIDIASGTFGLGVWTMPVGGGAWTELLPGVTPFSDGFAADGAGGFYVSDLVATGVIWHHRADGTTVPLPLTIRPGEGVDALERDPLTGELIVSTVSLGLGVGDSPRNRMLIVSP